MILLDIKCLLDICSLGPHLQRYTYPLVPPSEDDMVTHDFDKNIQFLAYLKVDDLNFYILLVSASKRMS